MGVKPIIATKTVATAGTAVQAVASGTYVTSVYFEALKTNTGVIYVGDSLVTSTLYMTALAAGVGFTLAADSFGTVGSSASGAELAAGTLYVNAGTSGDKVQVSYMQRLGQS